LRWAFFGTCAEEVLTEPVLNYTSKLDFLSKELIFLAQGTGLPGLKISYALDDSEMIFVVNLYCNQTAPHDANVNFFVNGVVDRKFAISGYSYYGKIIF